MMKHLNMLSLLKKLKAAISSIAIFMALTALVAMTITAFWNVLPIGNTELLHSIRWPIAFIILGFLVLNGNILINKR